MANILFVLRGRPGLGHVTPGLAIAQALLEAGHRSTVLTYHNGARFLQASPITEWSAIDVNAAYHDWPGLSLYPHGVRVVMPFIESHSPDFIVLGGEYFLAPIARIMNIDTAMILNQATFRKDTHSAWFKQTLSFLIEFCSLIFTISPIQTSKLHTSADGRTVRTIRGPFVLKTESPVSSAPGPKGLTVLIANGGGSDFPATIRSYSLENADPNSWRNMTYEMTRASIEATAKWCQPRDQVFVFSSLPQIDNDRLQEELHISGRVHLSQPSLEYYNILSKADIVISRAGASFLADTSVSSARVIMWPLTGHDEHEKLAHEIIEHDPSVAVCRTQESLGRCIEEAMLEARKRPNGVARAVLNQASVAAAEIEAQLGRITN